MSEHTIFECNVTGERYGALNAGDGVIQFDIVRKRDNGWDAWSETCHISNDVLEENDLFSRFNLRKFNRLFVERNKDGEEIVAAEYTRRRKDGNGQYKEFVERDEVVLATWDERFFRFVEDEILY